MKLHLLKPAIIKLLKVIHDFIEQYIILNGIKYFKAVGFREVIICRKNNIQAFAVVDSSCFV